MKQRKHPSVDERYIRPGRANDLMKAAQSIRQTVYICGATGYGKTSLAADFLARRRYEYYSMADNGSNPAVPAGQRPARERIVVVDDLHQLAGAEDRERYYDIFSDLADDPDVWLILISRCPLPAWLKPLYIQRVFVTIGERELSLTPADETVYLEKWGLSLLRETENQLRATAAGHPLTLRIAAMHLCAIPRCQSGEQRRQEELSALEQTRKDLWDYLETHVYDQWDVKLQEFLMEISVVDRFDLAMAQLITKRSDAGRLVLQAKETGDFLLEHTEGGVEYELRRPMRLSMRRRLAAKYPQTRIDDLYYNAGTGYELQGKIPEALAMYERCRNEDSISRLLIANARQHAGSGHYWELRRYYLELSEETVRQSPELMAGMSLLQSILLNDEQSERWYQALAEYAATQTGSVRKAAQSRLLYLDIVLPQKGTGQMTEILKCAWKFMTERKTLLPEMSLTNNQPSLMNGGKDFCEWSRRDRELAKSIGQPVEALLGGFGKGLVNTALAESFLEKGEDNYEVSVLAQKGRMQALAGGKQELVFVAVGLLGWLSVMNNHIEDALESLESFRAAAAAEAPQLLGGIDALKTRFLLYAGRSGEVAGWMTQAPDEDAEFCTLERYRYVTKARVYLAEGRREKALSLLQRLLLYAEQRQRTYLQIEAGLLLAVTQFRRNEHVWRQILQKAVTQAESYHFVRILTREGAALWELLRTAGLEWKDSDFKKRVMQECRQMAQLYPGYLSEKLAGSVRLSDKALKILRLQAEGMSVEQVAAAMNLSKAGVKYYNQETYKKLGVGGKAAAINEARNRKIL